MPDRDWSEAFSALPTETPEPLGWERLQARLPASTPRRNWPRWLAAAAVLAVVSAIPLMRMRADLRPTPQSAATLPAIAPAAITTTPERHEPVAGTADAAPSVAARTSISRHVRHVAAAAKPVHASPTTQSVAGDDLEPLYRQSARLEALLALARDEQVASGVSTALSDDLEARVANIDEQLTRPDLQPRQRTTLWQRRVDTLQQLAGIAATDRLYSARGQRHDAVLVSID